MFELNNVLIKAVNPAICEVLCNVFNNCFDKKCKSFNSIK